MTKKQRRLVRELRELTELLGLDYENAADYNPDARTTLLELTQRQLIISEVVTSFTLIDEHLNTIICHFFFGRRRSFPRLWKTKRFRLFNYYILEDLSLLAKLRFAKEIQKIPKNIVENIERVNSLRNALTHAFFPENLRRWKPQYKGKSIFTLEGVKLFRDEVAEINETLIVGRMPENDVT